MCPIPEIIGLQLVHLFFQIYEAFGNIRGHVQIIRLVALINASASHSARMPACSRFTPTIPLEQLFPTSFLGVVRVSDLVPGAILTLSYVIPMPELGNERCFYSRVPLPSYALRYVCLQPCVP